MRTLVDEASARVWQRERAEKVNRFTKSEESHRRTGWQKYDEDRKRLLDNA